MVVYVVSVVILSFAVKRIRKYANRRLEIREFRNNRTENLGSKERITARDGFGNVGIGKRLTFIHSPKFHGFVDHIGPCFGVLVNIKGKNAIGILHDRKTGSLVQAVGCMTGSDPAGNITGQGVKHTIIINVHRSCLYHESKRIHGPFLVSDKLVNVDVTDCSGIVIY